MFPMSMSSGGDEPCAASSSLWMVVGDRDHHATVASGAGATPHSGWFCCRGPLWAVVQVLTLSVLGE